MKTKTRRNLATAPAPAITPDFTSLFNTETDLLKQENKELHERVRQQSHAIRELNRTFRFVLKTLNKPLRVRQTKESAKRGDGV